MKTKNPFQNIKTKSSVIPLQEVTADSIIRKKRGRPSRPNMGKYLIKMDKLLNKELETKAENLGTSKSFVISQALKRYFKENQF